VHVNLSHQLRNSLLQSPTPPPTADARKQIELPCEQNGQHETAVEAVGMLQEQQNMYPCSTALYAKSSQVITSQKCADVIAPECLRLQMTDARLQLPPKQHSPKVAQTTKRNIGLS
jgi:hypothetical protein